MIKSRIILLVTGALLVWGIFQLPKVVVNSDDNSLSTDSISTDGIPPVSSLHPPAPESTRKAINKLRALYSTSAINEKNAIFADSLASLYGQTGMFDSAGWFAEEAAAFFNTPDSWAKAGNQYYQAYTFALDENRQKAWAEKAQDYYSKVLKVEPSNLTIKTRMAMTYLSSTPMQGIQMLREVLASDPENQDALFNLGMLSIQSGQYDRAIERLEKLTALNSRHVQGHLLLGIAHMNMGDKRKARQQFEKVKQMDTDPSVQATVDSYLKDLK